MASKRNKLTIKEVNRYFQCFSMIIALFFGTVVTHTNPEAATPISIPISNMYYAKNETHQKNIGFTKNFFNKSIIPQQLTLVYCKPLKFYQLKEKNVLAENIIPPPKIAFLYFQKIIENSV